jgi:5-methylcytosine-specific restriction endonuclease McrA
MTEDSSLKRCSGCGEHKPYEAFSKSSNTKDGYNYRCKQCVKKYYEANSEAICARMNAYYYNNIEKIREYERANAERIHARMRAYYRSNKEAFRTRQKAWRARNTEHLTRYNRAYLVEHKDEIMEQMRARRRANPYKHRNSNHKYRAHKKGNGGSVSDQDINDMRLAQGGICAYCQRQYDPDALTIDHIIPLDQGGVHDISNICLACPKCNFSKGNRTPEQWIDRWYLRQPKPMPDRRRKNKTDGDENV